MGGIKLHYFGLRNIVNMLSDGPAVAERFDGCIKYNSYLLRVLSSNLKADVEREVRNWGWMVISKKCDYYLCLAFEQNTRANDEPNLKHIYAIKQQNRNDLPLGIGRYSGEKVFAEFLSKPVGPAAVRLYDECQQFIADGKAVKIKPDELKSYLDAVKLAHRE